MILGSFFTFKFINNILANSNNILIQSTEELQTLAHLNNASNSIMRWLWTAYAKEGNDADRIVLLSFVKEEIVIVDNEIEKSLNYSLSQSEKFKNWPKLKNSIYKVLDLLSKNRVETDELARITILSELTPYMIPLSKSINVDYNLIEKQNIKEIDELKNRSEKVIFIIIFFLIFATVISYIFIFITNKVISDDLKKERIRIKIIGKFKKLAEKSSITKGRLLKTFSHELLTPLNSLEASIDLIKEVHNKLNLDERIQLETVLNLQTRLIQNFSTLINDLLDLLKLETNQFVPDVLQFSFNNATSDIMLNLKDYATSYNSTFIFNTQISSDDQFKGDIRRINRIIFNIATFCIRKFKSNVKLESKIENNNVYVVIETDGLNIQLTELNEVFSSVSLLSATIQKDSNDIALGVSITRDLAKAMKGSLTYVIHENKNVQFNLVVPLLPLNPSLEKPLATQLSNQNYEELPQKSIQQIKSFNILVVDDTIENIIILKGYLKKKNHKITIANNGLQAVELFQNGNFDIILMDINMPIMDGLEATKEIRKIEKEKQLFQIPIIAVSAFSSKEDFLKAKEAGTNDYHVKPVNLVELEKTIKNYCLRV